jgi:predicted nuclease of predicted toxin-antitoxin system
VRFLVDECTGPQVAAWLRGEGHDVFSVFDEARGIEDDTVIQKAYDQNWILITNDKDFGEKVYRGLQPHRGIISCDLTMNVPPIRFKSVGGCLNFIPTDLKVNL